VGKLLTAMTFVVGLAYTGRELCAEILGDDLDYQAISAETQRLEQMCRDHQALLEVRASLLRALGRGKLNLREACTQFTAASTKIFPLYLQHLNDLFPGTALETKVASNLVAHFEMLTAFEPGLADALPELERQLSEIVQPAPRN
jgi:hypothetical protein